MSRGKLIAFEGGDAGGKATQSKLLADKLGAKLISFPRYKTEIGKAILGSLKGEWAACVPNGDYEPDDKINALARQALFLMDRYAIAPVIEDYLHNGVDVVLDRYWPSGVIYGADDGLDKNVLIRAHMMLPQPDVWFLLDLDVEESTRRRPERRDQYEKDVEGAKRRRLAYLELFRQRQRFVHKGNCPASAIVTEIDYVFLSRCTCDVKHWFIVDGGVSIEDVHKQVLINCRGVFGRGFLNKEISK